MADANLIVRRFEADDLSDVVDLWRQAFPDEPPWNDPREVALRKCEVQPDLFLIGILDGDPVATVMIGYDGFRGWIYHLAVATQHRRQGIGRKMMIHAEQLLRTLGCPKVNLQVRSSNVEVVRFYESIGYHIEERASLGKLLS